MYRTEEEMLLAGHANNCKAHRSYETLTEARKARTSMMGSIKWDRTPLNVYQCRSCGQFHVGRVSSSDLL